MVGKRVQVGERLDVGLGSFAPEKEGVGLDAVIQGRGQALGNFRLDRLQVAHEDGGGGAKGRSHVAVAGGVAAHARVVIDHRVNAR